MFSIMTLPGFLFLRIKYDASYPIEIFVGFIIGSFLLQTIDMILGALSLPSLIRKRKKELKEAAQTKEN